MINYLTYFLFYNFNFVTNIHHKLQRRTVIQLYVVTEMGN